MSRLQITGTIMVIGGGVLFVAALALLPYVSFAIMAAARALLTDEPVLLALATGFSFYLFGRIFPVGFPVYDFYGAGFWLATAAAFTMSVGGVLAAVARRLQPQ
jgi:hypothetical protein